MKYGIYIGGYGAQGITYVELRDGKLTQVCDTACVNPSYLCLSPDGKHLYAVNETLTYGDRFGGSVTSFAVQENGKLTQTSVQPTGGTDPCHLFVVNGILLVANYSSGSLARFPLLADGRIGEALPLIHHMGHGPNPDRQESAHVHQAILSPYDSVAVCDLGLDTIFFYPLSELHTAAPKPIEVKVPAGYGPRHAVFLPEQDIWFVVCELKSRLLVYKGAPQHAECIAELPIGADGAENWPAALRLSSDRTMLLATGRGQDIIDLFRLDVDSMPHRICEIPSNGSWPRDAVFTPNGEHLLCADERGNRVTVYSLCGDTAELTQTFSIEKPSCFVFVPTDGKEE